MSPDDLPERIATKIRLDPDGGCWMWTASLCKGYGQQHWEGRNWKAHRLTYTLLIGPIPVGLTLDHYVCDTPACVNPAHTRPATIEHNSGRVSGRPLSEQCARGHAWTPENTLVSGTTPAGKPRRHCRACMRIRGARWHTPA